MGCRRIDRLSLTMHFKYAPTQCIYLSLGLPSTRRILLRAETLARSLSTVSSGISVTYLHLACLKAAHDSIKCSKVSGRSRAHTGQKVLLLLESGLVASCRSSSLAFVMRTLPGKCGIAR